MHWLVEPEHVNTQLRQRPVGPPRIASRVELKVKPPRFSHNFHSPLTAQRRQRLDALAALGVKLPKPITNAIANLEAAERAPWPGLGDLPPLPTLIAESKEQWKKTKQGNVNAAYVALQKAIRDNGATVYADLANLVDPKLNGNLGPILRAAENIRSLTWGTLQYLPPGTSFYKPVQAGDPVWTIAHLEDWVRDGAPKATADTIKAYGPGLYTPAEVIAHIEALPARTVIQHPESRFVKGSR